MMSLAGTVALQAKRPKALSTPARAMMLGGMWDSDVQADWCGKCEHKTGQGGRYAN